MHKVLILRVKTKAICNIELNYLSTTKIENQTSFFHFRLKMVLLRFIYETISANNFEF